MRARKKDTNKMKLIKRAQSYAQTLSEFVFFVANEVDFSATDAPATVYFNGSQVNLELGRRRSCSYAVWWLEQNLFVNDFETRFIIICRLCCQFIEDNFSSWVLSVDFSKESPIKSAKRSERAPFSGT